VRQAAATARCCGGLPKYFGGSFTLTSQQRPFAQLAGCLCLIWLLLNLPVLLGLRVLPWDAIDAFYPAVYFNSHTVRLGLAPWWNPYIYAGYPQIADPQGMMFSPLLMTWMLCRLAPGATWFAWGVLLHVLMGGLAMLALLRRSGANAFGALIGATVFMAGGVAASRLEHTPIIIGYAYAPVVLLALRYFLAAPGWRRSMLFGLTAGAMVTQLVQVTYLFVLMIVGYAIYASILHWREYSHAQKWRWCRGILFASLCALLLGLPQLIFSLAFVSLSNRSTLPLSASAPASLDWRVLLTLFDPNALHALRGTYSGPADRVEGYMYLGVMPTLLLVGIVPAWRTALQRRQILFFAAVAIIAVLYMLGVNGWLYGWLYAWLPGMAQFRRPSDAAFLLNFAFAIFTGLAASHFQLHSRRQLKRLLVISICWLLLSSLAMHSSWTNWQAATLLACIFGVVTFWRLKRPGSTARTALWLLALLVVDYRCFNLNGTFNQGHDGARTFKHDVVADKVLAIQQASNNRLSTRVETENAGAIWDNQVIIRGIFSTQGYNPLRYGLYDRWYGAREIATQPRVNTSYNQAADSKLTDLLSVALLVHGQEGNGKPWSAPSGYRKIFSAHPVDLWQNDNAYPRLLTPVDAFARTVDHLPTPVDFAATNFHEHFWLTPRNADDQRTGTLAASTCTGRLRVDETRHVPSKMTIRTSSNAPGWLVLSELDFPGWIADADGVELPIHRANGMFRAVCVPAGNHTVRLVFHPWTMVAEVWRRRAR
jgi:hypothetical protein